MNFNYTKLKYVVVVHGIRTWGRRMVMTDTSTLMAGLNVQYMTIYHNETLTNNTRFFAIIDSLICQIPSKIAKDF